MKHGRFEADQSGNGGRSQNPLEQEQPQKNNLMKNILLYLHDVVFLLGIGLVILLLCFRIVVVSGSSMKNTLLDGDYLLLVSNTFYRNPQCGDIIVASKDTYENGTPIVKRVIATEGQTVDIDFDEGIVYVDNEPLIEPYVSSAMIFEGVSFPLTVEKGCLFVMGDNRSVSQDSRSEKIGQIDRREVLGKAFLLFLPGTDRGQTFRDFSRIGVLS